MKIHPMDWLRWLCCCLGHKYNLLKGFIVTAIHIHLQVCIVDLEEDYGAHSDGYTLQNVFPGE